MEYRLNVEISESEVAILTNCWDFSTIKNLGRGGGPRPGLEDEEH